MTAAIALRSNSTSTPWSSTSQCAYGPDALPLARTAPINSGSTAS
ncbi:MULTISPECIES: hypothetical protein [unclassified Streptomyces]|nr:MULTISPECIES: hypothetical protein [unclassified Streptomyces]